MLKSILLAIGIAIAIPTIATAVALTFTANTVQPVNGVSQQGSNSTLLQNPNYGLGAQPSTIQGGTNVQGQ